ncbi:MAG: glycosyltransferase [Bacteroidales bacterium]
MKVAVICKTFMKGGAEKQALILTRLLADKNISVCLVNWEGRKVDRVNLDFIEKNSIRYYGLRGSILNKLFQFQRILRNEKISIIVSYLTMSNFLSGISKLFNRNIKCIGGIRNEKLPYAKFVLEKLIHNYLSDATVFNNYSGRMKFEKRGFDPAKAHVIQNAIDQDGPASLSKSPNGEINIVTVGRFVKQKDYATALHSFKILSERNRDKKFKYNIIGYGPLEKEIRFLAGKLKIDSKIRLFINPPNVYEILKKSDIFLSTSLFEGVSNSIMEAMVNGLPVVATDVGDNSYLIKDGQNGYLVPCRDPAGIAEKLERLSESPERRKEFGRNSQSVIENDFTQSKLLDNYMRLFSALQAVH